MERRSDRLAPGVPRDADRQGQDPEGRDRDQGDQDEGIDHDVADIERTVSNVGYEVPRYRGHRCRHEDDGSDPLMLAASQQRVAAADQQDGPEDQCQQCFHRSPVMAWLPE